MPGITSNTKLLIPFIGADGATNIVDTSPSGHVVTVGGNVVIDDAQSKFNGTSGLWGGTSGDKLNLDGSSEFAFSGDFTIEFWLRLASTGNVVVLYDSRPTSTEGVYATLYILNSDNKLYFYADSANRISGDTALSADTWYHVALTRSGTSTKLWLNGSQEGSTYSDSNNYLNPASRPVIGENGFSDGSPLGGWIDQFRIESQAIWNAAFTPYVLPYSEQSRGTPFQSPVIV